MTLFIGLASYARPRAFKLSLLSLAKTRIAKGVIAAIDVTDPLHEKEYLGAIKEIKELGIEIVVNLSKKRRGSPNARNKMLDLAEQMLKNNDILLLYDDDYICPGAHTLASAMHWLNDRDVGLVGGKVVNFRKRKVDPDIHLNTIAGLSDALTRATGFIFLDTKHGPRYVDYTTPLMATRIDVIKKGVRYDPNYKGTGYREESDLQLQVRKLGYRIIYEPKFYTYHLCLEEGGNRSLSDAAQRLYWKARNSTYFIRKHRFSTYKLVASNVIIITYALLLGSREAKAALDGFRKGVEVSIASR